MGAPHLGPGREFDLIREILTDAATPGPHVAVAAGDDCALVRAGEYYLALSLDLSIEGVHFQRDWGTPEEIGGRAVRAAASDLAAMAAAPIGALVAVVAPASDGGDLAVRLGRGARTAAETLGLTLLGGDLSRGGPTLALDVTAVGSVERPLLRGGVRAGDELWVTGRLGDAAAAVAAWRSGGRPTAAERERFWRPTPRLEEGRWLAARGATAAIDVSDGLAADAGHLAAASGVAIELEAAVVPRAQGGDLEMALSGGEDYELLVALPAGVLASGDATEFERRFGGPLTRVGRAVVGEGVRVFRDGEELRLARAGYDHFVEDEA
jgi:thiamine-monophosphate kinase